MIANLPIGQCMVTNLPIGQYMVTISHTTYPLLELGYQLNNRVVHGYPLGMFYNDTTQRNLVRDYQQLFWVVSNQHLTLKGFC